MDAVIETRSLAKRFGSFTALSSLDLSIQPGEVRALVGENGAGKSTLIKLLGGVYRKSAGEILVSGESVDFTSPLESRSRGIAILHQERNLIPSFPAYENAMLGMGTEKKAGLLVDFAAMRARVEAVCKSYGVDIPLDEVTHRLSPSQKTMLELVRCLVEKPRLLILDEPTASLGEEESAVLFAIIEKLKGEGVAVLYVSHRLSEVLSLSDRITVLKNGVEVGTLDSHDASHERLVEMMSGSLDDRKPMGTATFGRTVFTASHLSSRDGTVKDFSITIREGEIAGLFGLAGSGRTEALELVYGLRKRAGGSLVFNGEEIVDASPAKSLSRGIALIHEERRAKSIIPTFSVAGNITLSSLSGSFWSKRADEERAMAASKELEISCRSLEQKIAELSGGNQQKTVFARALLSKPRLLLCDEPTQAVDVKTRQEIHSLLRRLANEGVAILFVSSDLEEMLCGVDTVTIISGGRTWECLDAHDLSGSDVLSCCYKERENA